MYLPLSEVGHVVVETGSPLATPLAPQDTGGVYDTAIQHRAWQERCTERVVCVTKELR